MIFFCFRFPVVLFGRPGISISREIMLYLLSSRRCFFTVLKRDLFDGIDELEGHHSNRTTNYMYFTTSETEGEVVHVKLVQVHPQPQ